MEDKSKYSINPFENEMENEMCNINNEIWNIIMYKSINSIFFKLYKIYNCNFYYESKHIFNSKDLIEMQIKNSIKDKDFSINENDLIFILNNKNNKIKIDLEKIIVNKEEQLFLLGQQFRLCQKKNINKINELENKINELENKINEIYNILKYLKPKDIESINNIDDKTIKNNNLSLLLNSNENKNSEKKNHNQNILNQNNYIEAEYKIKDEDINKKNKVINSNSQDDKNTNYESIKKCEIYIDETLKDFNYDFEFKKNNQKIKFNFRELLTNTSQLFYECTSLYNIDLSKLISNEIINTSQMFFSCNSLINLDLSNFNTNKVTNMNRMFSHCSSLQYLNIKNFETNNVKDMSGMFNKCHSLKEIDLSKFKTNNVTDMSNMFSECNSLNELDLSNFETQNVNDMFQMFFKCSELTKLDIHNFSFNENNDTTEMFLHINDNCNIITDYLIKKN